VYADITADAVASQLRGAGVEVKKVRETGRPGTEGSRYGCTRAALEAVAERPDA